MSKAKREIRRGVCMTLELKNIGMIKEANVKIDGLTIIAGENDTGKSTVGKVLYLVINSLSVEKISNKELYGTDEINHLGRLNSYGKKIQDSIFSNISIRKDSIIKLSNNNKSFLYSNKLVEDELYQRDINVSSVITTFIETPVIWNLQEFFRSITDIESHLKLVGESIDIPYPFLMKDLYFKLSTKRNFTEEWTKNYSEKITNIINGTFQKDEDGIFRFYREEKKFDLIDVATGIKYFGILQVLLDNNRLNSYSLLILDEPEVHLHPKWQLEMAKIIVELVKNGVKILVNSHSPYMIEALQRYSELEKVNSDFYLAEDGYINKVNDSNAQTLGKIFEKLAEPFDVFEEMDSQSMEKLING